VYRDFGLCTTLFWSNKKRVAHEDGAEMLAQITKAMPFICYLTMAYDLTP
jgi:hypothetical protein